METNITWRVDGKISYISRNNGSGKSELAFVYDAMGNRVEKTVNNDAGAWSETEYYVRDAQGNVMAIYKKNVTSGQMNYILTEQHIYGSARLGVDRRGVDVIAASTVTDNVSRSIKRGEKHYELSNHLGNLLATVSDKKIAVMSGANLSYYRADVVSYSDYYPFGAPMTERTASLSDVRYGFNGKEMDGEIAGNGNAYDFGARMYDARLGRWWSVDPKIAKYPQMTPYNFVANMPIKAIDPDGKDIVILNAENSVGGLGHAAVLIGNDVDGWYLYSKNGTYSSSGSSGESNKHPENGIYFSSLEAFAKSSSNLDGNTGGGVYTRGFRISSSNEIDSKMKQAASEQVSSWYDVTGVVSGSCIDVAIDALRAGGFKDGSYTVTDGRGVEHDIAPSPVPNFAYEDIITQNKGTVVDEEIRRPKKIKSELTEEDLKKVNLEVAPKDNTRTKND